MLYLIFKNNLAFLSQKRKFFCQIFWRKYIFFKNHNIDLRLEAEVPAVRFGLRSQAVAASCGCRQEAEAKEDRGRER
jgi:hypothetical protein